MSKVKHRLCLQNICDLFDLHSSPYELRTAEFVIPRFNTVTYGRHSLRFMGPKLWNKLTHEVRSTLKHTFVD